MAVFEYTSRDKWLQLRSLLDGFFFTGREASLCQEETHTASIHQQLLAWARDC